MSAEKAQNRFGLRKFLFELQEAPHINFYNHCEGTRSPQNRDMSSQVYARYIPKKSQKVPKETTIATAQHVTNSQPIPQSTTIDASQSYARYVPLSKSRHAQNEQIDGVEPTNEAQSLPGSTKRKRDIPLKEENVSARNKKLKKEGKNRAADEDHNLEVHSPLQVNGDEPEASSKIISQDRKSKKSRTNVDHAQSEEGEDEQDARHMKLLRKREKSLRRAEKLSKKADAEPPEDVPLEPPELHDLVPLPQPEPIPQPAPQSLLSSLPSWLANPIRVLPTSTATFQSVGVIQEVEAQLQKQGFKQAFAVQAALLPRLLPGASQEDGDFLVSAATGSGKTLSYILPMVENITRNQVTKLRGLIVLPTRELVSQAKDVSEMCASMYTSTRRLRIGTAVGNETFKAEQSSLMEQELVYEPEKYRAQIRRLNKKWEGSESGSDGDLCDEEIVSDLPDHVYEPRSRVDILICTPGRLVEHLKKTPGFSLNDVQWLVVDEADKLLDQSFQEWLDVVMVSLQKPRKIILSATITRDVGKLNGLKLSRPQLVVVEETQDALSDALFLPVTLRECAIKVEEEGVKPLYLLDILRRAGIIVAPTEASEDSSSDDSTTSSSDESSSSSDEGLPVNGQVTINHTPLTTQHGALIFTKSNESAVRLGRLIALMKPASAENIGILTSTTRSSDRKHAIRSFEAGKLSILVASDLVSRGLDLTNLANVINYDIPTSLTSYVHRVGRTARAGKDGSAWTLHSSSEARWFWNEIGKSDGVKRATKVEGLKIDASTFDRELYEKALEALEEEATSR